MSIEFDFKDADECINVYTSEPLHDLFHENFTPSELLNDEDQALRVECAISLLKQFLQQAEDCHVLYWD
jgi:hypothetical protein